jgi:ABC-type nitrate/sulfonate/bicarbonate transport system substrate-binding protein
MSGSSLTSVERGEAALDDGLLYYTRCPVPTPSGLAVALGSLGPALGEAHGVDLRALQDVADPAVRRHHFDHGIVGLVRDGGNIPAIWARADGAPTRLLGLTWLNEAQAIVTTADAGIDSVADLVGNRVAVPVTGGTVVDVRGATALRGFERALATAGFGVADVLPVEVPAAELTGPTRDGAGESFDADLDLLEAGLVEAAFVKGAGGIAAIRDRGLKTIVRLDREPDPLARVNNGTPRTITARQELIDERPELVRTYLEVLGGAQPSVDGDRDELWRILARETHQDPADAAAAYGAADPDSLVPKLSRPRLDALQEQADFLFAHGFVPRRVEVDEWALNLGVDDE